MNMIQKQITRASDISRSVPGIVFVLFLIACTVIHPSNARAQSSEDQMEQVILDLRKLYLDTYPDLKDLIRYRKSGKTDAVNKLRDTLQQKINSNLKRIRRTLQNAKPEASGLLERWKTLQAMISRYEEYKDKVIENWKPKNPKVFKAFNKRELIEKGLAKPDMLRKQFLKELSSMLFTSGYVETNPVKQKLNRFEEEVRSMYANVLDTFLNLLEQIQEADEKDDQKKAKALKQAQSSWIQFWQQLDSKQKRLNKGINRELLLFRNRKKEHMSGILRQQYERGLRTKRQFQEIMEFKKKKQIFKNEQEVRKLLTMMAEKNILRNLTLIQEHGVQVFNFFDMFLKSGNISFRAKDQKSFQRRSKQVTQGITQLYRRRLDNLETGIKTLQDMPLQNLKRLSDQLTSRYQNEKQEKMGEVLEQLQEFAADTKEFAKDAKNFPRKFKNKLNDIEFRSRKQFQKEFSGMSEKVESFKERSDDLWERLSSIKRSAYEVLDSREKRKLLDSPQTKKDR